MAITLRQLEYFVTVVDEKSFTAAAALLHVTQPGLSHQIQALERELGGPLLERLPRNVRLTPAGRNALPHARASLAHADRASSAAKRASGVDAGELHVGTLYSISVGVLPKALGKWRQNYPDVHVRLVEFRRTQDLIAAMEAGQADVAVGPTPPEWNGPVEAIAGLLMMPETMVRHREEKEVEGVSLAAARGDASAPLVIQYNGDFHSDFGEGTAARVKRRLPTAKVIGFTR